jgi:sulfate adenylyltransferase subunit 2
MNRLDRLEAETIYALREAYARLSPLGMLWSIGKDSNALVWMIRKAFFGRAPFSMLLLDTGNELPEVYAFRDRYVKEWNLDYINIECPPTEETDPTLPPASRSAARKTLGLKRAIEKHKFQGVLLGIRRDEQAIRAKERIFSPRSESGDWDVRDQPPEFWNQYNTDVAPGSHVRVHAILNWTELDIWHYIRREGIPVVPLYFSRDGRRYRSLGEKNITFPIESNASTVDEIIAELENTTTPERMGRSMDHESEDAFERLRRGGYM